MMKGQQFSLREFFFLLVVVGYVFALIRLMSS